MEETYNLNQLAVMTGLTTRTLRTDLAMGILEGEKEEGMWVFTTEQFEAYLQNPIVRQRLTTKQNAVVYDFLADTSKKTNQICITLDLPVSDEEMMEVQQFFCSEMCHAQNAKFVCRKIRNLIRVTLAGSEDDVSGMLLKYYGRKA